MKRILHQTLTFFVLLILLTVIRFPYSEYVAGLIEELGKSLKPSGVVLEVEETKVGFPASLRFKNIGLAFTMAGVTVPLIVDQAFLDPSLLSLFLLQLSCEGTMELYGGTLGSELSSPFWGEKLSGELKGENLDLYRHPLLSAYGVHGILKLDSAFKLKETSDPRKPFVAEELRLEANIKNISYEGGYKVAGLVSLPKLEQGQADAQLLRLGDNVRLQKFEFTGSWGKANGSGTLSLTQQLQLKRAQLSFTLELSPQAVQSFGGYLALAAQIPPDQPPSQWRVNITKAENQRSPRVEIKPSR